MDWKTLSDMLCPSHVMFISCLPSIETFLPSTVSSTSALRLALVAKVRAACPALGFALVRRPWRGRERSRLDRIMLAAVLEGNSYEGEAMNVQVEVCNG